MSQHVEQEHFNSRCWLHFLRVKSDFAFSPSPDFKNGKLARVCSCFCCGHISSNATAPTTEWLRSTGSHNDTTRRRIFFSLAIPFPAKFISFGSTNISPFLTYHSLPTSRGLSHLCQSKKCRWNYDETAWRNRCTY